MYNPPSKKTQIIRQTITYTLMTVLVVVLVFILTLFVLGYRFDRATGTVEQGGLVQFNSVPTGAFLSIDSLRMSSATPAKTTLSSGSHTISMTKTGYDTWQKVVDVAKGSILWLNYARLIPTKLPVENVASLAAVTSTNASPNRKWLAITTNPTAPSIMLANISGDTPVMTTLTLPSDSYTVPTDPANENFQLTAWDPSSRYLLVQHNYADTSEWIVVDTQDVTQSKNLSSLFDVTITTAKFSQSNSRVLYALMNGDIRKIDLGNSTISAPLVRGVAEFSLFDKSTLTYVTTVDPTTKHRSVGYFEDGADAPRAIRSYSDDGTIPLHIAIGKYYNQTYVGIAYGTTIDILSGTLPDSDSGDTSSLKAVATMTVPSGVNYLSNRTNGRFFVAQDATSYSVYDLELQKLTTTTIQGSDTTPLTSELTWLDSYTPWSSVSGKLHLYEFDGANQHDIMPSLPGQNPSLSPNNRYLYTTTKDDKGAFHLSRVRLILP